MGSVEEASVLPILPPVVDWLIHLSTYRARQHLAHAPLDVLVDVNVFAHGVTHETQWITTSHSAAWDTPLGYLARVPVHASDCTADIYQSVQILPGIAHLARRGFLALKTSTELKAEEYRLSAARLIGGGFYDYSVFRGVRAESLDALPLGGYTFEELSGKKHQRDRLNASSDPMYRAMVDLLGRKNSQDAWHIRTAEAHGCFCFLTMDLGLLEDFDKVKHLEPFASLKTKLMTPKAFGEHFGLTPIPTIFLSYHGASFPVRPDLSQPGNNRIKWSKKSASSP